MGPYLSPAGRSPFARAVTKSGSTEAQPGGEGPRTESSPPLQAFFGGGNPARGGVLMPGIKSGRNEMREFRAGRIAPFLSQERCKQRRGGRSPPTARGGPLPFALSTLAALPATPGYLATGLDQSPGGGAPSTCQTASTPHRSHRDGRGCVGNRDLYGGQAAGVGWGGVGGDCTLASQIQACAGHPTPESLQWSVAPQKGTASTAAGQQRIAREALGEVAGES